MFIVLTLSDILSEFSFGQSKQNFPTGKYATHYISQYKCPWRETHFGFSNKEFQLSSVTQSCPTLCNPMDCSMPVHHQLLEFIQIQAHWVGDAIQPSHPLSSPTLPTFNLSQHQGLFKWVSSSHQVAKVQEFQSQHQSFQQTLRTDLL